MPQTAVQAGTFSRAQAYEAGVSAKRLALAVRRGQLERAWRDVFVVVGHRTSLTDDWAALLAATAAGPDVALAAWSAARALGMQWRDRPRGRACLALGVDDHRRLPGVVVLRHGLRPVDIVRADAQPPTTSRPRTVIDCLRVAPSLLRECMLDDALFHGWLTVDDLVDQVHAVGGQHGAPMLRALVPRVAGGARSAAERLAQRVLVHSGVEGWQFNHAVTLRGGRVAVLDAALPALRIAVEVDGRAYHSSPAQFQHDRTRQNALVAEGWIVLRFTWHDLTRRPHAVVAAVRDAVRLRT